MAERDDWEGHWDRFAAAASRNPAQGMRHALIERRLREGGGPARLLDLGSGQGDLLGRLARAMPGTALAGFELSQSGVAASRQKAPAARLVVADLFRPPPELAEFAGWATAAVCSEVLEHVDEPAEFLRAARPYLAAGARLVVTVPGGPMSAFDRHIGHRQHFNRASLTQVLRRSGFAPSRIDRAGFPFFNLYRAVVIARGRQLARDVEAGQAGFSAGLADGLMGAFRLLFRLNLSDFPLGWQLVATAQKEG